MTGGVTVYQNPTTGDNSAFNMKITGVEGGTELVLMLQTDCVKTNTWGVVSLTSLILNVYSDYDHYVEDCIDWPV